MNKKFCDKQHNTKTLPITNKRYQSRAEKISKEGSGCYEKSKRDGGPLIYNKERGSVIYTK